MKIALRLLILFLFILSSKELCAQNVYKTPSGERYHLATCSSAKNVSYRLKNIEEIRKFKLTPCRICKPPTPEKINFNVVPIHKEVGTLQFSVQCKGTKQRGTHCKHMTKIANGYCFQHQKQAPNK